MDENVNILEAYARWAESYDECDNPTRDLDREVLKQLPIEITNKDIIEVGCGTGKNTIWFAENANTVIALDISPEMLHIARTKVTRDNVSFLQHDITHPWPFADACCDVVSINLVLEHLESLDFVFSEAYRVLRRKGNLCICELHPEKHRNGSQARFVDPASKQVVKIQSYYHSKEEYREAGEKVGFDNIIFTDWFDRHDSNQSIPRLLSIVLRKEE